MCTGLEAAAIGSLVLGAAGTATQAIGTSRRAKAQADARNAQLANFLNKNEALSREAQGVLQRRLDQEGATPGEGLQPLETKRQEAANASIDRASAAAPIPLGGNAPQVVANRAAAAQGSTDAEAKRRAAALAGTRAFGDLLFEKGLASGEAQRDLGQINSFGRANAQLLPIQQDLAQQSKAGVGSGLALAGGIGSALGSLGAAAAGSGAFDGAGGGLTSGQRAINRTATAPVFSPKPAARPVNLGF